jgi:hypothetical protein
MKWWSCAFEMILSRPFFGGGPGSFEKMLNFYSSPGINSIYAHSFPLQTAAELGLPAALFLLLFFWLEIARSPSAFLAGGFVAVLFQSFLDFSLNIPGMFLIFLAVIGIANPQRGEEDIMLSGTISVPLWVLISSSALSLAWVWGIRPLLAFRESLNAEAAFDKMDLSSCESFLRRAIAWDGAPAKYHQALAQVLMIRYEKDPGTTQALDEALFFQKEALKREMTSKEYRRRMTEILELSGTGRGKRTG